MLKKWIVLVMLAVLTAGCAQMRPNVLFGSATLATKEFQVEDFDRIQAENGFRVTVTRGESFKVTITTHENIMPYVKVEKTNGALRLRVDPQPFIGYSINRLEAAVEMPVLAALNGSGGSQISVAGFSAQPAFAANLSGGSRLSGDMSATTMQMNSSGGSGGRLSGQASTLDFTASGGGRFDLGKFNVDYAVVNLSGGSSLTVDAGQLSYALSGGSQLRYVGSPQIGTQQTSGGSSARSVNP